MQFLAALLFAGSQIVFFLASEPLCNVSLSPLFTSSPFYLSPGEGADEQASKGKINSSFLATLLQTASMVVIYYAWEVSLLPFSLPHLRSFIHSPLPLFSSAFPLLRAYRILLLLVSDWIDHAIIPKNTQELMIRVSPKQTSRTSKNNLGIRMGIHTVKIRVMVMSMGMVGMRNLVLRRELEG